MVSIPGRNDPCPCGSGRKYKQCCLRAVAEIDVRWRRLREAEDALVPDVLSFALERGGEPYIDAASALFSDGAMPVPTENSICVTSSAIECVAPAGRTAD
jgi:hypothetical protein